MSQQTRNLNLNPGMGAGATLREGRYHLRRKLGQGGMGSVYLAEDALLPGRLVAVKENTDAGADAQAQFKREALLLARLRHPNLPQVTDYFFDPDGRQYLVMDYIPGDNLRQTDGAAPGALPVDEALAAVEQVMQALAYMHTWRDPERGAITPIIHRDIKPDNIKRTPDGRFYSSISASPKWTPTRRPRSAPARSRPATPPSSNITAAPTSVRTSTALAATLYALLTGKAPPSATDMAMASTKQPTPVIGALKGAPSAVAKVVERAMRTLPADRYQSIGAMYQALYNRPLPGVGGSQPGALGAPTARSRRPAFLLGALGVLLAMAGLGWLLFAQSTENPVTVAAETPVVLVAATVTATPAPLSPSAIAAETGAEVTATEIAGVEAAAPPVATEPPTASATASQPAVAPTLLLAAATPTPTASPSSTETPTATPTPTPSVTLTVTPTTGAPMAVVELDPLNLRAGPDTVFGLVAVLREGDALTVLGKSADAGWLQVRTEDGKTGWVAAAYVTLATPLDRVAVAAAPPTPAACSIAVADDFFGRWNRAELGCPVTISAVVWSAYQPFERGLMLWRQDTDRAYVFYNRGDWFASAEDWPEGAPVNNRGGAPAGLQEPHRGFGYLWGRDDAIFAGLGWATDTEKGFCARVQGFEKGFLLRSYPYGTCQGGLYNFAVEPGFGLTFLAALDSGTWRR
jgi:hypothetical protein